MTNSTNAEFPDTLVDYVPDQPTGYPEEWARLDTVEAYGDVEGMVEFPDHLWIEPRDWKTVAEQNDEYKTWPDDYANRFTNQSPTHECTCHTLLQVFETSLNRQLLDKSESIWVSALSIYAEANPRRWGGSTMQRTLGIARDRGFIPDHDGPGGKGTQKTRFAHTLHCTSGNVDYSSHGPFVRVSQFPDGWEDTAKLIRPLKYANLRSWEQIVCCILNGLAVGIGRYGHAMPYTGIVWRAGDAIHAKARDSYVRHTYDSLRAIKAAVGGAYAILTTTELPA